VNHQQFQDEILKLCRNKPIHVHWCRNLSAQRGFPDLVLIGIRGVKWRELKIPPDHLTSEQRALGYRLTASGQDWGVWTPNDLGNGVIIGDIEGLI